MDGEQENGWTGSCISCWQKPSFSVRSIPKRTIKKPMTQETTTWRAVVWAIAQSWWSVCPGWLFGHFESTQLGRVESCGDICEMTWNECMLDLPGFNRSLKHSRALHIKTQQLAAFLLNPQVSSYLSDLLLSCTCGQSKTVMMKEVQERFHDVSICFRI